MRRPSTPAFALTRRRNGEEEMEQKRALYRDIEAEEVWVVDEEGQIRFFNETEMEASQIAPTCPTEVELQ